MTELRQLQAEHEARLLRDMPAALEHYKLQLMQDLPFDPAASGFVFSFDEIDSALNREILQRRVEHAVKCKFELPEYLKRFPLIAA